MGIRTRVTAAFAVSLCLLLLYAGLGWWFSRSSTLLLIGVAVSVAWAVMAAWIRRRLNGSFQTLLTQIYASGEQTAVNPIQYAGRDELSAFVLEYNRLAKQLAVKTHEVQKLQDDYQQKFDQQVSEMEARVTQQTRSLKVQSEKANLDELTGLPNRREANAKLDLHWNCEALYGDKLACIVLDIDHFKRFNDNYGHAAGDLILKETAGLLRSNVRQSDTVCRIGGEEFLVICPEGGIEGAAACAEKLRNRVEQHHIAINGQLLRVTLSLGVTEREDSMLLCEDMVRQADECLYEAKRSGRNRVVVYGSGKSALQPAHELAAVPATIVEKTTPTPASQVSEDSNVSLVILADDPQRSEATTLSHTPGIMVVGIYTLDSEPEAWLKLRPDVVMLISSTVDRARSALARIQHEGAATGLPKLAWVDRADPVALAAVMDAGAQDCLSGSINAPLLAAKLRSMARIHRDRVGLAQSNQEHDRQQRRMALLYDYSSALAGAMSLSAVLHKTLSVIADLSDCRCLSILLPHDKHHSLMVASAFGLEEKAATGILVPYGHGMAGRVYQSGKQMLVEKEDPSSHACGKYDTPLFRGLPQACLPLKVGGKIIGVLNLSERPDGRRFEVEELDCINQIRNMAASAIADNLSRKSRDKAQDSIVEALGKLAEFRDDNTGRHLERVTQYSLLLAEHLRNTDAFRLQINETFLRDLRRSVPLHDIGKVGIPDQILLTPRKLSLEEMAIMKTHVKIGVETLRAVSHRVPDADYLKMAVDIAGGHHEWYNGSGYPAGLKGDGIPLAARIVALADVYDALTTRRPYKPAFSHEEARQTLYKASGLQFDPLVVDAFRQKEQQFAVLAKELSDETDEAATAVAVAEAGEKPIEMLEVVDASPPVVPSDASERIPAPIEAAVEELYPVVVGVSDSETADNPPQASEPIPAAPSPSRRRNDQREIEVYDLSPMD